MTKTPAQQPTPMTLQQRMDLSNQRAREMIAQIKSKES
jgi:hypothetical protein